MHEECEMPCAERIQRQRDKYRYSCPALLLLGGRYKQARNTGARKDLETLYSQAYCQRHILLSMSSLMSIIKAGEVAKEKIHFARGFQNMSNCTCLHSHVIDHWLYSGSWATSHSSDPYVRYFLKTAADESRAKSDDVYYPAGLAALRDESEAKSYNSYYPA
jgi:hypothetical protein